MKNYDALVAKWMSMDRTECLLDFVNITSYTVDGIEIGIMLTKAGAKASTSLLPY